MKTLTDAELANLCMPFAQVADGVLGGMWVMKETAGKVAAALIELKERRDGDNAKQES